MGERLKKNRKLAKARRDRKYQHEQRMREKITSLRKENGSMKLKNQKLRDEMEVLIRNRTNHSLNLKPGSTYRDLSAVLNPPIAPYHNEASKGAHITDTSLSIQRPVWSGNSTMVERNHSTAFDDLQSTNMGSPSAYQANTYPLFTNFPSSMNTASLQNILSSKQQEQEHQQKIGKIGMASLNQGIPQAFFAQGQNMPSSLKVTGVHEGNIQNMKQNILPTVTGQHDQHQHQQQEREIVMGFSSHNQGLHAQRNNQEQPSRPTNLIITRNSQNGITGMQQQILPSYKDQHQQEQQQQQQQQQQQLHHQRALNIPLFNQGILQGLPHAQERNSNDNNQQHPVNSFYS